ncbi:DUF4349 domain-containing protein [Haloplanus ruber]|uniref:DUF4349 domain-containing protein n=1 Tax=Haloplanus ruber TaxID=869892 RepID=A0ABD6CYL7_9EURY|nr:DUF4349 domain-containing protein [Haloplanus ruber]
MTRRSEAITVLLVALVLLAGCSGAGGGTDAGGGGDSGLTQASMAEERASGAAASGDGDRGERTDDAAPARTDRSIIRTGTVELRVDNYERSRSNLTALVASQGGYVGESTHQVHESGAAAWTEGRVVLRVPAENFSTTMDAIEREGEVRASRTATQDVTEQVVDLEARLENLRAERERLRTLYQQANDTEDVLAVERRLSEVQTEIERTEAELQNIQRQVAYSTVTVELTEPRPDRPAPDQWYDTPVVAAFLESVEGVGVALRAVVVAGAYAAPYLFVFLSPFAVVGGLLYRYRRRILGSS